MMRATRSSSACPWPLLPLYSLGVCWSMLPSWSRPSSWLLPWILSVGSQTISSKLMFLATNSTFRSSPPPMSASSSFFPSLLLLCFPCCFPKSSISRAQVLPLPELKFLHCHSSSSVPEAQVLLLPKLKFYSIARAEVPFHFQSSTSSPLPELQVPPLPELVLTAMEREHHLL